MNFEIGKRFCTEFVISVPIAISPSHVHMFLSGA